MRPDDVADAATERMSDLQPVTQGMRRVRHVYEGHTTIDLPEVDGVTLPPVPNLLQQGVDQMGGRIASTAPQITVVPTKTSRKEERRAATASRVLGGWWAHDRMLLKLQTRARHLVAYGATCTHLSWNSAEHRPTWQVRSPLNAFPSPDPHHKHPVPRDIMFVYSMTAGDLRKRGYSPQVTAVLNDYSDPQDSVQMTVYEYLDDMKHIMVLEGMDSLANRRRAVLEDVDHNLGIVPATYIQRTGLETLAGQFDQMIGMYEAQAMLMALEILAVQKGIFPDTYLESRPGEVAQFIDGPHDGRTGLVSIVAGGAIRETNPQPGYLTNPTIDRLERNQRVTGGIPPEFGGEAGSNLRTGRRGDAVLSATIDMPIAYAQTLLSDALECENRIAATLATTYDSGASRTLRKGLGNADKPVTYDAAVLFGDDRDSQVAYPAAGSDVNSLIIGLGQRVGLGIMSKETAGRLDPYVDNAESEHDRIITEGLETALLSGLQSQAASGQIPPDTLARVMRLVETDRLELAEAIQKAQEQAAAEQAAEAETPPGAGPAAASLSGNPEAMSPIPGVGEGSSDLTSLLGSLRMPTMGVANTVGQRTPSGQVRA